MQIPSTKVEAAAATKDVRAYINQPWLDVERKRIVATDGSIMAIVPIETGDEDVTGPIPTEAIKAARKMYRDTGDAPDLIKANGAIVFPNGYTIPRPEGIGTFPDVDRVVPKVAADAQPDVSIDARLLARLQEAIADQGAKYHGVSLYFQRDQDGRIDATAPILVKPGTRCDSGAIGVLMPLRP